MPETSNEYEGGYVNTLAHNRNYWKDNQTVARKANLTVVVAFCELVIGLVTSEERLRPKLGKMRVQAVGINKTVFEAVIKSFGITRQGLNFFLFFFVFWFLFKNFFFFIVFIFIFIFIFIFLLLVPQFISTIENEQNIDRKDNRSMIITTDEENNKTNNNMGEEKELQVVSNKEKEDGGTAAEKEDDQVGGGAESEQNS
jgi:hypothetical protein